MNRAVTGLLARIRRSLQNPVLVGEDGYRKRYLRVQWWIVVWRLLILVQIPEVALVRPDLLGSWSRTLALFILVLSYTCLYAWIATRTRLAGSTRLQLADIAVCAAFMLIAGEPKLIFIMSFYSFSALLTRPTTLVRRTLPAAVFLSLAYLVAAVMSGMDPVHFFDSPREVDNFALYFFWALGYVGFSGVLERVSAMELDSILAEQRRVYRRRLHDDLGNTLCGLHFKIQSLRKSDTRETLKQSLDFLAAGYDRAVGVLDRLLTGIDEQVSGDLNHSLQALKRSIEEDTGLSVRLDVTRQMLEVSPEVQREMVCILREAAMNAARHAGVDRIDIKAYGRRGKIIAAVTDRGRGFTAGDLQARQLDGHLGMKGMRERAETIRGKLDIKSNRAAGTRVSLEVEGIRPGLVSRVLDNTTENTGGGLYHFLVRLRVFMYVWTVIRLLLLTPATHISPALVLVLAVLAVDCFAFVLFRTGAYRLLNAHPWILAGEMAGFSFLIYICLQSGIMFFFPLYLGVVVLMNGLFLDTLRNMVLTLLLNSGIFLAYVLAPADAETVMRGLRFEEPLQHATIFMILGFSAGIAGEFVRSLESLQVRAIGQALSRQREMLSAETHRQLHEQVDGLGEEIRALNPGFQVLEEALDAGAIQRLRSSSTELKTRLRAILNSLEDYGAKPV